MTAIKKDTIWDVQNNINLHESIRCDDERYTDLSEGRGEFDFNDLKRRLRIRNNNLNTPIQQSIHLFCGHRGCGKSTELIRFAKDIDKKNLFMVVSADAGKDLDLDSLEFVDIFILVAEKFFLKAEELQLKLDQTYLQNLYNWFQKKILISKTTEDYKADLGLDLKSGITIPLFAKLLLKLNTSLQLKNNHSEEVRQDVKNSFSDFSDLFNQLLKHAREKIKEIGRKEILFIVDGLDKLDSLETTKKIFIENYQNLLKINGNFIFTVQVDVLSLDTTIKERYNTQVFPMVKIVDIDGKKNEKGYKVLRDLIKNRADLDLFEKEVDIDLLIKYSGGNPRQLLKLLESTIVNVQSEEDDAKFETKAIRTSIEKLAQDFMLFMNENEYKESVHIDNIKEKGEFKASDLRTQLLHRLIIFQYNDFFWRTNPLVTTLFYYKKFKNELTS